MLRTETRTGILMDSPTLRNTSTAWRRN